MPKLAYQDFEISIGQPDRSSRRAKTAYPVKARSADGEAAGEFVLPFSHGQLSDLEEGPWLEQSVLEAYGKQLYNTLFNTDVRALFTTSALSC